MNLIAAAAIIAALLTGPLPQAGVTTRDLAAPGENPGAQFAQNELQPAPPPEQSSEDRIPAFWIILPD